MYGRAVSRWPDSSLFWKFLHKQSMCLPSDGNSVSIVGHENEVSETFAFSTVFSIRKNLFIRPRRKSLFYVLLLRCGDIESCSGPVGHSSKHL